MEKEIDIWGIAINVRKGVNNFEIPEISLLGECKCDEEHGMCIGFRNKQFIGIDQQNWTF